MLNIEAIRNPDATEDDVIAGVRVTGTADKPAIFSDRRCRSNGQSHLLRGKDWIVNRAARSDDFMPTAPGVASTKYQVVGKIGETFGASNQH